MSDLLELTPVLAEEVSRGAGFFGDAVLNSRWTELLAELRRAAQAEAEPQ